MAKYQAALHADIEARKGREGLSGELARYREIVQRQGSAMVSEAFGGRDAATACFNFERSLNGGKFNIGPEFYMYAEVSKLLEAVGR